MKKVIDKIQRDVFKRKMKYLNYVLNFDGLEVKVKISLN